MKEVRISRSLLSYAALKKGDMTVFVLLRDDMVFCFQCYHVGDRVSLPVLVVIDEELERALCFVSFGHLDLTFDSAPGAFYVVLKIRIGVIFI